MPKGKEEEFFKKNVLELKTKEKGRSVTVASVDDTIKGAFIKYLIGLKHDRSVRVSLNIRKTLRNENNSL